MDRAEQKGYCMKIAVIGAGYVGLVTGACFANAGNQVICVDKNLEKVQELKKGIVTIYEPDLEELVKYNIKKNRLVFSDNIRQAVENSEICFVTVGTPEGEDGAPNTKDVIDVATEISYAINNYKIIVNKSTVPIGMANKISKIIKNNSKLPFDVVSNPEFLRQGNAVKDFINPERIIIGSSSKKAVNMMKTLYSPFIKTSDSFIVMDIKSAEMTKYAANSFLATKISFINEISNLCEKVGANVEMVRKGISFDSRIGNKFLSPGLGYGGSCFPKDVRALINIGEQNNCNMTIAKAVNQVNIRQRDVFLEKITRRFGQNLSTRTFAVLGLSFKPGTDDTREAPSITIIENLLKLGAKVRVYDPKAEERAKKILSKDVVFTSNPYRALENASALLLVTEWDEFKQLNFNKVRDIMQSPVIFDGRNLYDTNPLVKEIFEYYQMGVSHD